MHIIIAILILILVMYILRYFGLPDTFGSPLPVELQQMHFIIHAPLPGTLFNSAQQIMYSKENMLVMDDPIAGKMTSRYYFNSKENLFKAFPLEKYEVTQKRATRFLK